MTTISPINVPEVEKQGETKKGSFFKQTDLERREAAWALGIDYPEEGGGDLGSGAGVPCHHLPEVPLLHCTWDHTGGGCRLIWPKLDGYRISRTFWRF